MDHESSSRGYDDTYGKEVGVSVSDIIMNYQEEQEIPRPKPSEPILATVMSIGSDGLYIKMDGSTSYRSKAFLGNPDVAYKTGDRVLVMRIGSTYIVICRIGVPTGKLVADSAVQVDNHAAGKANIEFYKDTRGVLWARNAAGSTWDKFTGTTGTPPGEID